MMTGHSDGDDGGASASSPVVSPSEIDAWVTKGKRDEEGGADEGATAASSKTWKEYHDLLNHGEEGGDGDEQQQEGKGDAAANVPDLDGSADSVSAGTAADPTRPDDNDEAGTGDAGERRNEGLDLRREAELEQASYEARLATLLLKAHRRDRGRRGATAGSGKKDATAVMEEEGVGYRPNLAFNHDQDISDNEVEEKEEDNPSASRDGEDRSSPHASAAAATNQKCKRPRPANESEELNASTSMTTASSLHLAILRKRRQKKKKKTNKRQKDEASEEGSSLAGTAATRNDDDDDGALLDPLDWRAAASSLS